MVMSVTERVSVKKTAGWPNAVMAIFAHLVVDSAKLKSSVPNKMNVHQVSTAMKITAFPMNARTVCSAW